MFNFPKKIFLLSFVVLLSACNTFTDVWQDTENFYQKPLQHLLVFRVTNNEGQRRNFEDTLALFFKKRGVEAEPVYQIDQYLTLKENSNLDKQSMNSLSQQTKADSILLVQRARVNKKTVTSHFYSVEIAEEYETEYLAIKLLHLPSGRLLWSGTIRGTNTSYLAIAKMLIKSLGDAKLI